MTSNPAMRREELWALCLPGRARAERHHAAIDRLVELQEEMAKVENPFLVFQLLNQATLLMQLLMAEIAEPFLAPMFDGSLLEHLGFPMERMEARGEMLAALHQQDAACSPLHRSGLDPAVAILPRKLLKALVDALGALDVGEVLPLLAAAPAGKAKRAWSRSQMRLRALEHVAFLDGQGTKKLSARFAAAQALGDVSESTLRGWRAGLRDLVPDLHTRLVRAKQAGELALVLQRDPTFGSRPGETIDANVYWLLIELRDIEPLAVFGKRYQLEFQQ
jgi:hypothetical protein